MRSILIFLRFITLNILVFVFIDITNADKVKRNIEDREDNSDNDENDSMNIPERENENTNNVTCTRRTNSRMHEILAAKHMQFPFVAAIMSSQNEYLCSGAVVSNGLILTTAQCVQKAPTYVFLNTTKDKKDDTVVLLHIKKTEKFPSFTGEESTKDVGLIYTAKHNSSIATKIRLSNYTSTQNVVDLEAIGFGLNSAVGQVKELQYVGLEHRPYNTADLLRAYFDCFDTKVMTCFKDTGGPVTFDNELMGIVIKGQDECTKEMSSMYAVNKRMADILPTYTFKSWLDEKIKKNEEQEQIPLVAYPLKPVLREKKVHRMTTSATQIVSSNYFLLIIFSLFIYFC